MSFEKDPSESRLCPKCQVHRNICVCRYCLPLDNAPELWALQHPSEHGLSKGTLRVAQACIQNLRVLVGESKDDFAPLRAQSEPWNTGVLFPTTQSRAIETAQAELPGRWIIIDGTWRKARRIFLANPWLARLPQFHFQDPPPSAYRIRKTARGGSLATVEAIGYLLSITHPELNTEPLDRGLQALIEAQLLQMPDQVRKRYD